MSPLSGIRYQESSYSSLQNPRQFYNLSLVCLQSGRCPTQLPCVTVGVAVDHMIAVFELIRSPLVWLDAVIAGDE